MSESIWSDPEQGQAYCDYLAVLHQEGLSFPQIGRRLGLKTNAVIGKAHRMHLPGRKHELKLIDDVKLKLEKQAGRRRPKYKLAQLPTAISRSRVLTAEFLCLIGDLSNTTCRYPLWRDHAPVSEQFYCGAPSANQVKGMPYCAGHADLCFNGTDRRLVPR